MIGKEGCAGEVRPGKASCLFPPRRAARAHEDRCGVRRSGGTSRWLAPAALAFLAGIVATLLVVDLLVGRPPAAMAQTPADVRLGARGLFAVTGSISRERDALYLIDTDSGVICVYGYDPSARRFGLLAVRSFLYDRKLTDFNNEETTNPEAIRSLVEQLKPPKPEP